MPLDSASDRAFQMFAEAYAKAWAPKPRLVLEQADPAEPPLTEDDEALIADIITKSRAWGENPF